MIVVPPSERLPVGCWANFTGCNWSITQLFPDHVAWRNFPRPPQGRRRTGGRRWAGCRRYCMPAANNISRCPAGIEVLRLGWDALARGQVRSGVLCLAGTLADCTLLSLLFGRHNCGPPVLCHLSSLGGTTVGPQHLPSQVFGRHNCGPPVHFRLSSWAFCHFFNSISGTAPQDLSDLL